MPSSPDYLAELIAALKADRLERLYKAMGSPSSQELMLRLEQPSTQNKTPTQLQQSRNVAPSGLVASSSSAPRQPSPISKGIEKLLVDFHNEVVGKLGNVEKQSDAAIRKALWDFCLVPIATLSPRHAALRFESPIMTRALEELFKTPNEQLSPLLQIMKRYLKDFKEELSKTDPFDPREVEKRMNFQLRAHGEPEIRLPHPYFLDYSTEPPRTVPNPDASNNAMHIERANELLADLANRKPALHATILELWEQYVAFLQYQDEGVESKGDDRGGGSGSAPSGMVG